MQVRHGRKRDLPVLDLPHDDAAAQSRDEKRAQPPAFGASAYFILSDGQEASSSVKLSFTDNDDNQRAIDDTSVNAAPCRTCCSR